MLPEWLPGAPMLERNAHFRKLHFFMEKCLLFYARKSDWADDTTFPYEGAQAPEAQRFKAGIYLRSDDHSGATLGPLVGSRGQSPRKLRGFR